MQPIQNTTVQNTPEIMDMQKQKPTRKTYFTSDGGPADDAKPPRLLGKKINKYGLNIALRLAVSMKSYDLYTIKRVDNTINV
nr:hypothetical protein [Tanacetum cinerariifolium]